MVVCGVSANKVGMSLMRCFWQILGQHAEGALVLMKMLLTNTSAYQYF